MTHDTTGPRANLRTPWVAPSEDVAADPRDAKIADLEKERDGAVFLRELADAAVTIRDAKIVALKALLKEARIIMRPFAEAAESYSPDDDPHSVAWAHDFMIGSLRGACDLMFRISMVMPIEITNEMIDAILSEDDGGKTG